MEHNNPKKVQIKAIKAPSRKHESASKEEKRNLLEQKKVAAIEAKERKYHDKKRRKRSVTVSAVPGKKNTYVSVYKEKVISTADPTKKIQLIR